MCQEEIKEEVPTREQCKSCYGTMIEKLDRKLDRVRLVSTLYVTGVLLDYLFVYCVMINYKDKCIDLDTKLGFAALTSRSLLEILNVIIFFLKFKFKSLKSKLAKNSLRKTVINIFTQKNINKILLGKGMTKKEFRHFLVLHQILSIILVSLVYQVLLLLSFTSKGRKGMIFIALNYLLGPHLHRLFVVIKILLRRRTTSSHQYRTRVACLFFFVYIYSSQFFAALWYLPAIYKETRCWQEAYRNITGSSTNYDVFSCSSKSLDINRSISDYCYTNTSKYDFGIYSDVHKFEMLGTKCSPRKILYFSRWALQCLSSFAQGLEAGDNIWQNIFVIFIILYGVFMFFFLIGEVQTERQKLVKLKPKLKETGNWMTKKSLPKDLQSKITKYEQDKWPQAKDVNIEKMIHNLPNKLRGKLTRELCLHLLKKVEEFGKWSEASLEELSNCVKPVFYAERTRVIREGDPIDEMVFIVQGVLWTYPSRGGTIGSESTSSCSHINDHHMKDGDFYGEELVKWVQADPYSFDFPVATKNIQAVTNVDALALLAYDLKNIFIKHSEIHNSKRNAQTATQEANTAQQCVQTVS